MELSYVESIFKDVWPMLVIFLVVIVSIRLMYLHCNREKFVFYRELFSVIFLVYSLLLFQLLTNNELNYINGFNITPFSEILRYPIGSYNFYLNVVGNILLFIPFGYFVSSYIKASRISHILIVSLITSVTIEIVQYYIGRSFDIDDILLNVVGAVVGFLLYIAFSAIQKRLPRFFRSETFYNIVCVLALGFIIYYVLGMFGVKIF